MTLWTSKPLRWFVDPPWRGQGLTEGDLLQGFGTEVRERKRKQKARLTPGPRAATKGPRVFDDDTQMARKANNPKVEA